MGDFVAQQATVKTINVFSLLKFFYFIGLNVTLRKFIAQFDKIILFVTFRVVGLLAISVQFAKERK